MVLSDGGQPINYEAVKIGRGLNEMNEGEIPKAARLTIQKHFDIHYFHINNLISQWDMFMR